MEFDGSKSQGPFSFIGFKWQVPLIPVWGTLLLKSGGSEIRPFAKMMKVQTQQHLAIKLRK